MFTIDELYQPATLEETAALLLAHPDVVVLGGCGFLKMGSRRIPKALDLSRCGLDSIRETPTEIQIGAMTTLYTLETNVTLNQLFDAIVPKAVGNILGVQFRSCATIGASVYAKYGFSDILPALLVLDTEVELMKNGRMSLRQFLDRPVIRDILIRVYIRKDNRHASYQNLRNAGADFPILNAAVSRFADQWTVVAGARPGKAQIAAATSRRLSKAAEAGPINVAEFAGEAAQELTFGSNNKASAEYRQAMCEVLVKRAIEEVLSCG